MLRDSQCARATVVNSVLHKTERICATDQSNCTRLGTAADFVVLGYRHFGIGFHEAIEFVHGNIKLTYLVVFYL